MHLLTNLDFRAHFLKASVVVLSSVEKVGIIGLGKLGLPLAAVVAEAGFLVTGVDSNASLIKKLQASDFMSDEPGLSDILERSCKNLSFSTKYESLLNMDIIYIILPTPSDSSGKFDDSMVIFAIKNLLQIWQNQDKELVVVIVSTLMPQTCDEKILPLIQVNSSKIKLLYSPEFIALGSVIRDLKKPDMLLIGAELPQDAELHIKIQQRIIGHDKKIDVLTLLEAELVKLLINCYVTMKISFANYVGEIGDILYGRINTIAIANAIGMDSRIGTKYIMPGLGYGGPCFPRDNKALIRWSVDHNISPDLARGTETINSRQPSLMVERIIRKFGNISTVGILGYTYKSRTNVTEESQRITIANLLAQKGFEVIVCDPLVYQPQIFLDGISVCKKTSELNSCQLIITSIEYKEYFDPGFSGAYYFM